MAKKLFVGNLSWGTTNDSLRDFFATVGNVASAQVIMDKMTGKARGFGFVEFETEEDAEKAKAELNGKALDGREITINDAREKEERNDRYQGNRGGGFNRDNNRGGNRY